jgi:serine/threonine-protein kinase HipA
MAQRAGIPVPHFRLEKIIGKNVLLLGRFDRKGEHVRIPFLSAMSMLGASDGDRRSYIEIGEVLQEYGARTSEDLIDLWRRIVFNILISNVDDHLRNHGFLYEGPSGWRLSPFYDLEPTPDHVKARILHTNIDLNNGTASLDLAYEVIEYFGLILAAAIKIALKVGNAVREWGKEASRFGAGKQEIDFMRSAFNHADLKQALTGSVFFAP